MLSHPTLRKGREEISKGGLGGKERKGGMKGTEEEGLAGQETDRRRGKWRRM